MILEFKTKTDRNGNTYHLSIDTEKKIFFDHTYGGIEISRTDYKNLIETLKENGYTFRIKIY